MYVASRIRLPVNSSEGLVVLFRWELGRGTRTSVLMFTFVNGGVVLPEELGNCTEIFCVASNGRFDHQPLV